MKTLIIHPEDNSTAFLDIVYKNIPNKTVITNGLSAERLKVAMEDHDRIMMMGHGSPNGLFSVGVFPDSGPFVINKKHVPILSKKTNSVYIWCNADYFVQENNLAGLYSGMFISEVGEAYYCGLPGVGQDIVDESNFSFCEILAECIQEPQEVAYQKLKEQYGKIAEENPVAYYNNNRLYLKIL